MKPIEHLRNTLVLNCGDRIDPPTIERICAEMERALFDHAVPALVEKPESKNPSLWRYFQTAFDKKITFHAVGVDRMPDGGFHFYIHPQSVSGDTQDYLLWPDPFNWSDLLVNRLDSPPPDVEKFKAMLEKEFPSQPATFRIRCDSP